MKLKIITIMFIAISGLSFAEPSRTDNPELLQHNLEQIKKFFRSVSPHHLHDLAQQSLPSGAGNNSNLQTPDSTTNSSSPNNPGSTTNTIPAGPGQLSAAGAAQPKAPPPSPATPTSTNSNSIANPADTSSKAPITAHQTLQANHYWNLQQTDIRAVINEVSKMTGKNFMIDPRVQGKLTLVSNTEIADKDIYPVFLSMLQVAGFTAIQQGEITKIMPITDARTDAALYNPLLVSPRPGDELMVQVMPVHYVPADQLVPVLRPLLPQWSTVAAYAPSNMLILSGRATNIRQLADIIHQVDSSSSVGIDIVPLKHALAMDVTPTLQALFKNQGGQGGSRTPPVIASDDRGNAILISGSKTDRIRLRLLINELDQSNPNATQSNTEVVYLNYMRAEDLVPVLAGIAQAGFSGVVGTTIGTITQPQLDSSNPAASMVPNPSSGTVTSNPMVPTGGSQNLGQNQNQNNQSSNNQNEGNTKPSIQIIGEPNTNSIIMNGPKSILKNLKKVIQQLDIKPAQILIEAMVAQINSDEVNHLGIQWGSVTDPTAARSITNFTPGLAIINSQTSINQFQANVNALYTEKKANILSTPSVVVLDNRQAKILVGKQVSVASSSYPNNAGGTTTASPYNTFDRVNVALHLYVRPQITRDGGIQLQIDQGNDTLQGATDTLSTNQFPVFNISAIVTSVQVQTGNIIVLGGLNQEQLSNNNTDVPILKDIPGIGRFFQDNDTERQKTTLMVFIRPFIIHNNNDVALFSSGKYQHLRQDQLKYMREQEVFDERDRDQVAPPWHSEAIPKPFNAASIHVQK